MAPRGSARRSPPIPPARCAPRQKTFHSGIGSSRLCMRPESSSAPWSARTRPPRPTSPAGLSLPCRSAWHRHPSSLERSTRARSGRARERVQLESIPMVPRALPIVRTTASGGMSWRLGRVTTDTPESSVMPSRPLAEGRGRSPHVQRASPVREQSATCRSRHGRAMARTALVTNDLGFNAVGRPCACSCRWT